MTTLTPQPLHPEPQPFPVQRAGSRSTSLVPVPSEDESRLINALRSGEEAAFASLLERYHAPLIRLAMTFVPNRDVAEEVVQQTWVAVIEGLDRFEGRSLLKTWIFRILMNQAKTRGVREARSVPFSQCGSGDGDSGEPPVDPDRFLTQGRFVGHWASPPQRWDDRTPEKVLLSKEGLGQIEQAIAALPPNQRQVILLRDVEGLPSDEVCNVLGLSETNQRVLLHRARSKVRGALERYLQGGTTTR